MKLASLKSVNNQDGELCLVNRKLTTVTKVDHLVKTLQEAIDHWEEVKEPLNEIYLALNEGKITNTFPFTPQQMAAPLPRAYQWLDGSAYVNHVELVRKSRGVEMPADFWTVPLMYQGGSDTFLGANDAIQVADEGYGIDFEAEVAVITDNVPMGIDAEKAAEHIKLIMLVNDVSLRALAQAELARGFGFLHTKPSSSFSPVALTPDELVPHWDGKRLNLPLYSYINEQLFGQPNAGIDMTFSFPQLIAHAAKTRRLAAGTIIGSGTVSNTDRTKGSSCIIERRMLETLAEGKPHTEFLHFGDRVHIEMRDTEGCSYFGAIDQVITQYGTPK